MNASVAAAAACAILALALATAETDAGSGSANAKASAQDPPVDRMVCRQETKTGSRFTRRTCMRASEWAARAEAARRAFSEVQNRPMVKIEPPNGSGDR
jgi:hypothetical protein